MQKLAEMSDYSDEELQDALAKLKMRRKLLDQAIAALTRLAVLQRGTQPNKIAIAGESSASEKFQTAAV